MGFHGVFPKRAVATETDFFLASPEPSRGASSEKREQLLWQKRGQWQASQEAN